MTEFCDHPNTPDAISKCRVCTPVLHPSVVALREFFKDNPTFLDIDSLGTESAYLHNRLELTFLEGWNACQKAAQKAMGIQ